MCPKYEINIGLPLPFLSSLGYLASLVMFRMVSMVDSLTFFNCISGPVSRRYSRRLREDVRQVGFDPFRLLSFLA